MKKQMQIFMLVLLALLQGMAPLAHAHVNGHSEDHHVHLAGLDLHHGLLQQATPEVSAEDEDIAQVVGMQPEFRGKHVELAACLPTEKLHIPEMADRLIAVIRPTVSGINLPHIPYLYPASQAPPA